MIDTHTHLYSEEFDEDRTEMIKRAINKGVTEFYLPAIDSESHEKMLQLEAEFPNQIFAMMGLHPCYVKPETYKQELDVVENNLFNTEHHFVAVGEIGIDLHWDKTTLDIQKETFEIQCDWAIEKNIPIAIHSRDATYILIEILKKRKKNPEGVFHCFTGSLEEANEINKLGFFLGIGGVVTYKNTHLRDTLKHISLEKIVLETDAPYLPPVPYRGKRNESAYTNLVAETLCSVYQRSLEEIAAITTKNAQILFKV